MKKMVFLVCFLIVMVTSGCAASQESSGGYEAPTSHQGHHH